MRRGGVPLSARRSTPARWDEGGQGRLAGPPSGRCRRDRELALSAASIARTIIARTVISRTVIGYTLHTYHPTGFPNRVEQPGRRAGCLPPGEQRGAPRRVPRAERRAAATGDHPVVPAAQPPGAAAPRDGLPGQGVGASVSAPEDGPTPCGRIFVPATRGWRLRCATSNRSCRRSSMTAPAPGAEAARAAGLPVVLDRRRCAGAPQSAAAVARGAWGPLGRCVPPHTAATSHTHAAALSRGGPGGARAAAGCRGPGRTGRRSRLPPPTP